MAPWAKAEARSLSVCRSSSKAMEGARRMGGASPRTLRTSNLTVLRYCASHLLSLVVLIPHPVHSSFLCYLP